MPIKKTPPTDEKPVRLSLAERYLATLRRKDPEGVDAILRARVDAAGRTETGSIYISDLEELKGVLSEEFDAMIARTESMVDGGIEAIRAKGHATYVKLACSAAKSEMVNTLTEAGARAMAHLMVEGRDGAMGIIGNQQQKYPGVWRLASYMFDEDVAAATVWKDVKDQLGQVSTSPVSMPTGALFVIYIEIIETTGAAAPVYDQYGKPTAQAPAALLPPGFTDAIEKMAETNRILAERMTPQA
jgi:predicted enzyme related to lactoylglutathione lyase